MQFAIDPQTGKRITANTFHKRYGTKTTTGLIHHSAECPYCHHDLFIRQGTKHIHFWHGTNPAYCQSIVPFGQPYMGLTPTKPNLAHAAALRTQFKGEWQLHYNELANLIPLFSYVEFLLLLKEALSKNIFAYTGMRIEDMPYVLVLALDYPPTTSIGKKRGFWFRFWYTSSVRKAEDLWINTPENIELVRASFLPPSPPVRFPDFDTDLVTDKIQKRSCFRQATPPNLKPFIIDEVAKWFEKHPSF